MLIDAHTHVQFPQFDQDRDQVIRRSFDAGVWMINAGSNKENSQKTVELAHKYEEGIYATVGMHPEDVDYTKEDNFNYEFFKNLAKDEKVVAIGECGLEYFRRSNEPEITDKEKDKQKALFIKHIELAKEIGKPLMIHCREAFPDLIAILESHILNHKSPGIIHFFTGTLKDAQKLLEMGFYFTFGGLITFNREFDEVLQHIPLDRILLETDAPYVSPTPYRGKRNEPAYVVEVAKKMAEIKNIAYEEICEITTQNAKKIFNLT